MAKTYAVGVDTTPKPTVAITKGAALFTNVPVSFAGCAIVVMLALFAMWANICVIDWHIYSSDLSYNPQFIGVNQLDILSLPALKITSTEELNSGYQISAETTQKPAFCPRCACVANLHLHGQNDQHFKDFPLHGKPVTIQVARKRYKCLECGKTFMEPLADMDEKRWCTKRLVEHIQKRCLERTFTSVAAELDMDEKTVRNIFNDMVEACGLEFKFQTPDWLGIDELHILGSARCVIGNVRNHTIVDMLRARNKDAVAHRLLKFKGREKIELVTMDMWNPYRSAIRETLPNARVVVDKFHIVRLVNKAVDTARKHERSESGAQKTKGLKKDRYLLLRRERDLAANDGMMLAMWKENFPKLGRIHTLKEDFFRIWEESSTPQIAIAAYNDWKARLDGDTAWAFEELTRAIENWHAEVFLYFECPLTNAYIEALNSVVRAINRQGRGYSFDVLRFKILMHQLHHLPKPSPMAAITDIPTLLHLLGGRMRMPDPTTFSE